jgi:hypothetical protein
MAKRGRPKKMKTEENVATAEKTHTQEKINPEHVPLHDLPLETYADYKIYNKRVRMENKKARKNIYQCKPCPIDLHPKQRIIFGRKDQPRNPLPVYLSTDMIDFKLTLVPGKTYDLPIMVLSHLNSKGSPIWERYVNDDGSEDSRISHYDPRFSIRTVFEDNE